MVCLSIQGVHMATKAQATTMLTYADVCRSVRLSKLGIWHKSSGDNKDRASDAMRLNWTL
jgi:hypothetical protein